MINDERTTQTENAGKSVLSPFNPVYTGVGGGGRGEQIMPVATLNLNALFDIWENALKLQTFSEIYVGKI